MIAEFEKFLLRGSGDKSGGGFGLEWRVADLHPDPDSANLATFVLQSCHDFRGKLSQFCRQRAVAHGDVEGTVAQAEYLAGLRKVGLHDTGKVLLQFCQGSHGTEQCVQFLTVVHQVF